jgi:hypothetical protein
MLLVRAALLQVRAIAADGDQVNRRRDPASRDEVGDEGGEALLIVRRHAVMVAQAWRLSASDNPMLLSKVG